MVPGSNYFLDLQSDWLLTALREGIIILNDNEVAKNNDRCYKTGDNSVS